MPVNPIAAKIHSSRQRVWERRLEHRSTIHNAANASAKRRTNISNAEKSTSNARVLANVTPHIAMTIATHNQRLTLTVLVVSTDMSRRDREIGGSMLTTNCFSCRNFQVPGHEQSAQQPPAQVVQGRHCLSFCIRRQYRYSKI